MGAAMNPLNMSDTPAAPNRRKGRWQLILILLMVIGPMVLATLMYKLQFWVPDNRSDHGEMIGNGQTRADIGVQADEQRWQLLVTAPQPAPPIASNWSTSRANCRSAWAVMRPAPAMPWPVRSRLVPNTRPS